MAQQWGESFGGPPGVPVVRYGNGPLVRLRYDHGCTGRVMREGLSQSIVRWKNGNEDCVCNDWIERIEEGGAVTGRFTSATPNFEEVDRTAAPVALPKVRKEPDALARRVAEFDDAELRAFALANGCWDDKYAALPNNGLRRMNVMNRLRAKLKREAGYQVRWT